MKAIYTTTTHVTLVMELCTGGELFEKLVNYQHYQEREAALLIKQVASAAEHLHKRKVVHRDIKPENLIFVDESCRTLKLCDFGISELLPPEGYLTESIGTQTYMAPEVARSQPYNTSSDMFSIGVLLHIMLCGYPPFPKNYLESETPPTLDFSLPDWKDISPSVKDLLTTLLSFNPSIRPTATKVVSHPWIVGFHHDFIQKSYSEAYYETKKVAKTSRSNRLSTGNERGAIKKKDQGDAHFVGGVSILCLVTRRKTDEDLSKPDPPTSPVVPEHKSPVPSLPSIPSQTLPDTSPLYPKPLSAKTPKNEKRSRIGNMKSPRKVEKKVQTPSTVIRFARREPNQAGKGEEGGNDTEDGKISKLVIEEEKRAEGEDFQGTPQRIEAGEERLKSPRNREEKSRKATRDRSKAETKKISQSDEVVSPKVSKTKKLSQEELLSPQKNERKKGAGEGDVKRTSNMEGNGETNPTLFEEEVNKLKEKNKKLHAKLIEVQNQNQVLKELAEELKKERDYARNERDSIMINFSSKSHENPPKSTTETQSPLATPEPKTEKKEPQVAQKNQLIESNILDIQSILSKQKAYQERPVSMPAEVLKHHHHTNTHLHHSHSHSLTGTKEEKGQEMLMRDALFRGIVESLLESKISLPEQFWSNHLNFCEAEMVKSLETKSALPKQLHFKTSEDPYQTYKSTKALLQEALSKK
uniref:Protein kinase domain-containing protein n=1 Tax=Arcella intermedia TaxID=1963864 RepID=A0A6B2KYA8_9EUKA